MKVRDTEGVEPGRISPGVGQKGGGIVRRLTNDRARLGERGNKRMESGNGCVCVCGTKRDAVM